MKLEYNKSSNSYENIILLQNNGSRSGIIFGMLDDPSNTLTELEKSIDIYPKTLVLHPGEESNIIISIKKDLYDKYSNTNFLQSTILMVWTEEINRIKTYYKLKENSELLRLMKSNYSIDNDITEKEMKLINKESNDYPLDLRILNEESNKNCYKLLHNNNLNKIFEYIHYNESLRSIFIDFTIQSDKIKNKIEKIDEGTEMDKENIIPIDSNVLSLLL